MANDIEFMSTAVKAGLKAGTGLMVECDSALERSVIAFKNSTMQLSLRSFEMVQAYENYASSSTSFEEFYPAYQNYLDSGIDMLAEYNTYLSCYNHAVKESKAGDNFYCDCLSKLVGQDEGYCSMKSLYAETNAFFKQCLRSVLKCVGLSDAQIEEGMAGIK